MNIVLHEPEIPQNTGNIARTCVAVGATLHLIEPIGFSLDEKQLKRAGLDYWDKLNYRMYKDFDEFVVLNNNPKIYMATTKATKTYADATYEKNAYIMFGKESAGIPEEILLNYKDTSIRIPMSQNIRSLNISNAVAVTLYEALRQNNFDNLETAGQLHHHKW
ncbi:tRNA (uridine(34)/cytosine(34)/5-carboxymethylaminomethyluridine(34)-2'-O)-methyltransferase TrmL [Candidatus Epulonipiscium fishelsonii]|uniref:tRNA (Uridine(34)/cytosine(34)/5-carboxymethylaminomethyluridine(34)-2'-O)-methyltransferase TrmL n=1 Tax=Candidatus Epulonipiscium fishelsonii TaxID=77094 RepID=A0ACC8XGP2_9FIRM|nr:tRNA (uridine(34)/cytosine(34)/5-carboxymethylaminomethyluridine(34)-2'-O)-methyltransferase TrmL [Epulopiscium sp. SCG-B05WGA-EpuloA1]ONI42494.1 tRNA (uridine(34)/cytosine(34)/5-carboxymethylaminomethyluridine(34)-2'-O)-methyltransferase TrmL [Epulopiscium sp. SCG-B11WGA-EpuloA1]